jgi:hypothetical protein
MLLLAIGVLVLEYSFRVLVWFKTNRGFISYHEMINNFFPSDLDEIEFPLRSITEIAYQCSITTTKAWEKGGAPTASVRNLGVWKNKLDNNGATKDNKMITIIGILYVQLLQICESHSENKKKTNVVTTSGKFIRRTRRFSSKLFFFLNGS